MKTIYKYTECRAKEQNVNKGYEIYFRLYRYQKNKAPILVEQGLFDECAKRWEDKYKATLTHDNPYPTYD